MSKSSRFYPFILVQVSHILIDYVHHAIEIAQYSYVVHFDNHQLADGESFPSC
jgi:hypothetical protein